MAIRTEVRERFKDGFDLGFEWLERRQPRWRARRTIRALDAVLELVNGLVKSEPETARRHVDRILRLVSVAQLTPVGRPLSTSVGDRPPSPDPRSDLSWPALEGMTYAVLASVHTALRQTDVSLKILHAMSQRDLPDAILSSVFRRRAVASVECQAWVDAERFATTAVRLGETASYKTWWKTPYRSLAAALCARSYVVGTLYERGLADVARLEEVAADAVRTAELARADGFEATEAMALNTLARAGALGAFGGYTLAVEVPKVARSSVHWPKSRWTHALVLCARAGELTPPAERAFREAREDFYRRGRLDEAAQVTLDLQWWLLARGEARRAALESGWLLEHLDSTSLDREVIGTWAQEVQRRQLTAKLVETVYREVRSLPRVSVPFVRFRR